jgi:hypothetical protein
MMKHLYRESLQKLHSELKNATADQPKAREAISGLSMNVMTILEHPGDAPFIHHHNLLNNLKDSVTLFETRHPALTVAVNNVINSLSNMGI